MWTSTRTKPYAPSLTSCWPRSFPTKPISFLRGHREIRHWLRLGGRPGTRFWASSSTCWNRSRSGRPGLGVQAYVELPTEEPTFNSGAWRTKAGVSGERDFGFDLLLSQEVREAEFLFNLGYKRVGDPESGTRVQFVNSGAVRPEDFWVGFGGESKLDLKDEIRLVGGASFPAFHVLRYQAWFVGEFFYKRFVGSGTPVQSVVHPLDSLVGLQINPNPIPWLSFGAGWLLRWNSAGKGGERSSPFLTPDGRGDINFTELVGSGYGGTRDRIPQEPGCDPG